MLSLPDNNQHSQFDLMSQLYINKKLRSKTESIALSGDLVFKKRSCIDDLSDLLEEENECKANENINELYPKVSQNDEIITPDWDKLFKEICSERCCQ